MSGKVKKETKNKSKKEPKKQIKMNPQKPGQHQLVLVRHGESEWLEKNIFCGWYDSQLTEKGKKEAVTAAEALKTEKIKFDAAYTSILSRAEETLTIILKNLNQSNIPIERSWRLNERHYGDLTGLNKRETVEKYGEAQVKLWRRSYDVPPPSISPCNKYYNDITRDPKYKNVITRDEFPMTESLKMTMERLKPYWDQNIAPLLKKSKSILIVSHGTTLRGIVKFVGNLSDQEIANTDLPAGIPFYYMLDDNLKANGKMKYLASDATVEKAIEETRNIIR